MVSSVRAAMIEKIREAKKEQIEENKEQIHSSIEEEIVKVRARTSKGHYIKDDPNTAENEAWIEKPNSNKKTKTVKKKKTPYKKV